MFKSKKSRKPQFNIEIRGDFGQSYQLKYNDEEIGQIPDMRRFREAYIGAIFTFFGQKYEVHSHEKDAVVFN